MGVKVIDDPAKHDFVVRVTVPRAGVPVTEGGKPGEVDNDGKPVVVAIPAERIAREVLAQAMAQCGTGHSASQFTDAQIDSNQDMSPREAAKLKAGRIVIAAS